MLQLLDVLPPNRYGGPTISGEPNYLALFGCTIIVLIIAVFLYKVFGIRRVKVTKKTVSSKKKATKKK